MPFNPLSRNGLHDPFADQSGNLGGEIRITDYLFPQIIVNFEYYRICNVSLIYNSMIRKILITGTIAVLFCIGSCNKDDRDSLVKDEYDPQGTFEYGGKVYGYRYYGDQTWMVENLAWLPAVSPSTAISTADPLYYVYDYEGTSVIAAKATENYKNYGVLYNWEAARTACPPGWRLPSDEDWKTLERLWGMPESEIDATSFTSLRETGKIGYDWKSTTGWYGLLNEGCGLNFGGFNVKPGGFFCPDGGYNFNAETFYAFFWTSTEYGSNAYSRMLSCWEDGVRRTNTDSRRTGMSVRCIKNE
jgi:uncharacterized protein (TIGR02145 family)